MASCDDDYVLLGDEAQSQHQPQTRAVPFSGPTATKGFVVDGGGGEDHEGCGEAFGQTDASKCLVAPAFDDHCFVVDDNTFADRHSATIVSERCNKHKVGKSVEQCTNKIDNLKKRYKVECQWLNCGGVPAGHWPWFKKMEQIVGSSSSSPKTAPDEDKSIIVGGPAAWYSLAGVGPQNVDPKVDY
ncbi:hypothetical protein BHM03_00011291 [Ensete ventricosum]|nr:hypothetical protein BHM03_00011291 [Ensete ventricosum]